MDDDRRVAEGEAPVGGERRFLADCMLGRLARWLRVLGYDVAYERRAEDDQLIARVLAEGRTLLTRDTKLVRRRPLRRAATPPILIASDQPDEQIAEMVRSHGVTFRPERFLSRCLVDNEPTRRAAKEAVRDRVPPYVHATQETFSVCPACGRVYWRATHVASIVRRLERRLGRAPLLDTPAGGR